MTTKALAWLMSFFSFFAVWNLQAQPNKIPETRTSPYGDSMPPDKYGTWPSDEFETGKLPFCLSPGLQKGIIELKGKLIGGSQTDSLLILHKGKIVYEQYYNGYDKDTVHKQFSITKSVMSALIGIAIGEGHIGGVNDKVIDYFPDAVIPAGQESKRDMTIEHLLTMTSGIDTDVYWNAFMEAGGLDAAPGTVPLFPADTNDSALWAFELPQKRAPGTKYQYDSVVPSILGGILEQATGRKLLDYAQEKLFGPLGMTSVEWDKAPDGLPLGGFGISMTPRDMARFGYLYLNYGRWEDKQIIPADFVAITPPRSKSIMAYGYLFWNHSLAPFSNYYEANGVNGQLIIMKPSRDIVVVRTGDARPSDGFIARIGKALGIQ